MSSDMISIAASGTRAAQAALDITSQNIANASTTGYVRRSVNQTELSSKSTSSSAGDISQNGVLVTGIARNVDAFQQSEVRRTNSDATRADTLVTGLTTVSDAVDNSGVYSAITSYQTAVSNLTATPTDSSLRANVVASATTMAQSFNVASTSLASAQSGLQQSASSGVTQVNQLAKSLAQLNLQISSDTDPLNDNATLLDQRDSILQQMSSYGDITTTIAANNVVKVQMGGASGPTLVGTDGTSSTLAMATASDGTVSFTLGGSALTLSGGSLAGQQQTLTSAATAKTSLDGIANSLMTAVNTNQTSGVDLTGATGTAMFTGTGAGDMAVALTSGSQLATAPSGSAAGSQVATNLTSLQSSLSTTDIAGQTNSLLFSLSSAVAGNTTTRDTLDTISTNAQTTLSSQSGVTLDTEAANLVRYQQAYQASGKVIQVAQTLFNQILAL